MNALVLVATSLVLTGPPEAAVPTGFPATDLALTMTDSPDPVGAWFTWVESSRVTYHLTVTNLGPAIAVDVVLTVPLPTGPGVDPQLPNPPCVNFGGGEYTCTFAWIQPGTSVSADVSVMVLEQAPAVLETGVATVHAASPDPNVSNNSATASTTVLPSVSGSCEGFALEGNAGLTPVFCAINRLGAQVPTSIVTYSFGAGTATPDVDFVSSSGTVTFGPGEEFKQVPFAVVGDTLPEPHDTFRVQLTNPVGAVVVSDPDLHWDVIQNDDRGAVVGDLTHGFVHRGPVPGHATERVADVFEVQSGDYEASYEVVVDESSGDAAMLPAITDFGGQGMIFGSPTGTGKASSLRFSSYSPIMSIRRQVMAVNEACGGSCGPEDTYRLRFYETTLTGGRFNNAGSQESIVILHNTRQETISGSVMFWAPNGSFAASKPFTVLSRGSYVLRTADIPAITEASGSITVVHDAPYGTLTGKVAAFDPANGFSFDTPLAPKPR